MNNKEDFKVEITQDKLVDLLLHAATREDIAKQDTKIDSVEAKLSTKIDGVESRLNSKIEDVESKLNSKIDGVESRLNNRMDAFEARVSTQFKWAIGTTIGGVIAIISSMIGLASFLTHFINH